MKKYFLILIFCLSCQKKESRIGDNIKLELSTYTDQNKTKAFVIPVIKSGSELIATLNRKLIDYYELNKNNLAFKISK